MTQTIITGLMALAFCAVHIWIRSLRFLDVEPRSRWLSFAGGVAVGYVFMHILPELGAHTLTFERATGFSAGLSDAWVYLLALAGLVLFYGIERAVKLSRADENDSDGETPGTGQFWLHIGASAVLIAVIGYLLNYREDASNWGLAIYFVAMLLHFVTADYGARAHHAELYDRAGRWVLSAATLTGWALGLALELPELAIGGLFAFVAGGIILLVLKEELPEQRQSAFLPFLAGAVLYAGLVLAELAIIA